MAVTIHEPKRIAVTDLEKLYGPVRTRAILDRLLASKTGIDALHPLKPEQLSTFIDLLEGKPVHTKGSMQTFGAVAKVALLSRPPAKHQALKWARATQAELLKAATPDGNGKVRHRRRRRKHA